MSYSKIRTITRHHSNIPIPVYDISVKHNHNFAVEGGLIVHNCLPYQFFKSVIYEKRLILYDKCDLLTEEIIGLERDNNTGRIDHSPTGINSKDACDSVCAAVWNASKHIEEFNFDFGETLDAIVDVSSSSSQEQTQQQVLLDFESELLRARQAVPDKKQEEDYFLDFGFGKRGENFDNYMMDGIII